MLRRLYIKIYLTLIASLVLMVVLGVVLWEVFDHDGTDSDYLDRAELVAALVLPPADAPVAEQRRFLTRLGSDLDVDIGLYDASGEAIVVVGDPTMPPRRKIGKSDWYRGRGGPVLSLNLPDERWLLIDPRRETGAGPLVGLLFMLCLAALCVGLAAFPLVRQLTRRLEHLQRGVESIGAGDLSARVDVRGRDEVARLAVSFNEAAEKIETLVGAHRLLLANASHELRTPLSRIRLGLEMAEGRDTPERRAALRQDIAELDALIDEILLMSRLDSGSTLDDDQKVDLVALAAEECARYENCSVSGSAPEIDGDPLLLHRLLRNLLENAQKHGAPPVIVELGSTDTAVTLTVRDGGNGVADADRERVFQPFYRGSDRQNIKGYGLGLPLVRQIAAAHGGSVTLVDRQRHPSAIEVVLPRADDA